MQRVTVVPGHGARVSPLGEHESLPWIRARNWPEQPPAADLPGREREVEEALRAAGDGKAVGFHAPYGSGVTSLLRHVAARLDAEDHTAALYLRAGRDGADELLQRLFELLYATSEALKPTPDQCEALLDQARPVLLLDDVLSEPEELEKLLEALPDSAAVVGGARPPLAPERGGSHALEGLRGDLAVEALRRAQGRNPTGEERVTALRVVDAVGRRPLHLEFIATLTRREGRSFSALEEELNAASGAPAEVVERLRLELLERAERQVLAAFQHAGGWPLRTAAVAAVTGVPVAGPLELLQRGHLITKEDEDLFAAPARPSEPFREIAAELDPAQAARGLAGWLELQPAAGEDARSCAEAAAYLVGVTAERGQWQVALRLAQAAETALLLAGRWGSCRRVLELGRAAARTVGDRPAEAHCSHQLGVLALCQDDVDRARGMLERAVQLRGDLADHAGVAVSVDNLKRLPPPVTISAPLPTPTPVPTPEPDRPPRPEPRPRRRHQRRAQVPSPQASPQPASTDRVRTPQADSPKTSPSQAKAEQTSPPQASPPQTKTEQVRTPQASTEQTSTEQTDPPRADPPKTDPLQQVNPPQESTEQTRPPQTSPEQVRTPQADPPQVDPPKTDPTQTDPTLVRLPQVRLPQVSPPQVSPPQVGLQRVRRWLVPVGLLVALLAAAALGINSILALADEPSESDTQATGTSGATPRPEAEAEAGAEGGPPGWSVAPEALDFGTEAVGAVSGSQELSAASQGGGPTAIGSIEVRGDAQDFQVARRCVGALVPVGSFCRVQVQFAPTSPGDKEAVVVVGFETDDRTVQARLTGTGA